MLLLSLVLALIPLLGIAYIVMFANVTSVDGLFMSLILLTVSGIFFINTLLELKQRRTKSLAAPAKASQAAASAVSPPPRIQSAPATGEARTEAGVVVDITYFEAPVGHANQSFVTFQPNGARGSHVIVLAGDLRNALPVGKRVKITYTAAEEGNRLLTAE